MYTPMCIQRTHPADSFVCVEAAQASAPIVLAPGEYWVGAMDVVP